MNNTDNITFFSTLIAKALLACLMAFLITAYPVPFWAAALLIFIV